MAVNKKQLRRPRQSAVDLAVAAVVEGNLNPLDDEGMSAVNPGRTSLDLPQEEEGCPAGGMYSNCHFSRPDMDECILCGQLVREDCA